ncbi:MAG: ribonuclease P protein component [Candidatus Riflebacteria bacterium]|nr:ribonuclease P protein component [Candidatus Riflebacteria bacterium]
MPPASRFRLTTIKLRSEIDRASRLGRSFASPLFVLVCLVVPEGAPRVAIKIPRKVGGAVVRNRIRRQVKDICRALFPRLGTPCDCIVIARMASAGASFRQKMEEIQSLLARHGCFDPSR